jgi:hypothetical protein
MGGFVSRSTTLLSVAFLASIAPAYASLSFNTAWGPTLSADSTYGPTIESDINAVLGIYEADISNNITVNIEFDEMTSGLGESGSAAVVVNYVDYCNALRANATGAAAATALGAGGSIGPTCSSTNPVNGGTTIEVHTANARALGLSASPPSDGEVLVNTQITDSGTGPCTGSGCYSFDEVVEHEVDEVLGLGSSLLNVSCSGSACATTNVTALSSIEPEDLFRYSAAGTRSYAAGTACNALGSAYFSIDGGNTNLAGFNNACNGGDFGDWDTGSARVQNWAAYPETNPGLGVELTALNVIGFNLQSEVPEPSTVVLSATILGAMILLRRKCGASGKA